MVEINTSALFNNMTGLASKIFNEKNLVPAALAGLTIGMFSYVSLRGKSIRRARDIIDDIVTGMAGSALGSIAGGGSAMGAIGMFIPAYAEVGDMIAEALVPVPTGGTEDDTIPDSDIFLAAAGIAVVSAVAVLLAAPEGEGPISGPIKDRLFGGA